MSAGGRSRTAALALLVGVVVVVGAAVVVPAALYWSKTGAIIRDARLKTLRDEQRNDSRAALAITQERWDAFVSSPSSGLALAASEADGIASIKERVRAEFSRLGGSVTNIEAEAGDGPRAGIRTIVIEVRGTLPRKQLGPILEALESTPAFIIVTRFDAVVQSSDTLRLSIGGTAYRMAEAAS